MMKAILLAIMCLFATSSANGQSQPFSGTFTSHNCFSGDSFVLDSSGVAEHLGWSDTIIENYPHYLHKGERGIYTFSGHMLLLTYNEVIVDSAAWRAKGDQDWIVDPEQWFAEVASKLPGIRDTLLVRTIGTETVLFRPKYASDFPACQEYLVSSPDADQCDNEYPEVCYGVFRPSSKGP